VKIYLFSLAAGVLVGIIYGLLNVRSPAPPVVALLGLLGILVGEQVTAAAKRLMAGKPVTTAWLKTDCAPQILGTPIGTGALREARDQRHDPPTRNI
jgi:XapX domain-containing protein